MFSFNVSLLFQVRVAREKNSINGRYFSKRKVVSIVGFGFSQLWKKTVMLRLLGQLSQLF